MRHFGGFDRYLHYKFKLTKFQGMSREFKVQNTLVSSRHVLYCNAASVKDAIDVKHSYRLWLFKIDKQIKENIYVQK